MRRIALRLSIVTFTFAVGLLGVWLFRLPYPVKKSNPDKYVASLAAISLKQRPRFRMTFRACGNGYTQGYDTSDLQEMAEGSIGYETRAEARKNIAGMLARAARVVEKVSHYKNRFGEAGERLVLVFPADKAGHEPASILWFDGNKILHFIDAPSLELAREFEESNAYDAP